jgi:hypothetical protein
MDAIFIILNQCFENLIFALLSFINSLFFSFSLEEFIYNYLITLSNYIIPKKGV